MPIKRTQEQIDSDAVSDIASETPSKKPTPDPATITTNDESGGTTVTGSSSKVPQSILQRRREGRLRAMEKLQNKLDAIGIRRTDFENNLQFSSIPQIQLINQKNYYTDYLKKDEQSIIVRELKSKLNEARVSKKSTPVDDKKNQDIISKLKDSSSNTVASSPRSEFDDDDDDEDNDDDNENQADEEGTGTFIIHPGSANIRIGLSTDIDPITIPNIIAYKLKNQAKKDYTKDTDPEREILSNSDVKIADSNFIKYKKTISSNFRERMKYYKRRILPNSNETCFNFNKKVQPELIKDHDDVHRIEYLTTDSIKSNVLIGDDVLNLENFDDWLIRSPFLNGSFNDNDSNYKSQQELIGDIELILSMALKSKFNLSTRKKQLNSFNCILIIPNLFDKYYVEGMIKLLISSIGFGKVTVLQEGLSATFGLGISSGCVVDIGSTSTKICCVEDGSVITNSSVELSYGSSDITRLFIKNLVSQQFPYKDINLNNLRDWKLANELKEKNITFNDANLAIQIFSFVNRQPNKLSEKFEFKCFDEVMISPMGLFYPNAFVDESGKELTDGNGIILGKLSPNKLLSNKLFGTYGKLDGLEPINDVLESTAQNSQIEGKSITDMNLNELVNHMLVNPPKTTSELSEESNDENSGATVTANSVTNTKEFLTTNESRINMTPLDKAIIESIVYSAFGDQAKYDRLFSNILIVGGGSKVEALENILIDRLHLSRVGLLGSNKMGECVKLINSWKAEFESKEESKTESFKLNKGMINEINQMINSSVLTGIEILSNSKDMDPSTLIWKGGSVFARLKIADELWITERYWDLLGPRVMNYTSLFNY